MYEHAERLIFEPLRARRLIAAGGVCAQRHRLGLEPVGFLVRREQRSRNTHDTQDGKNCFHGVILGW
jgi:hypothetical protein